MTVRKARNENGNYHTIHCVCVFDGVCVCVDICVSIRLILVCIHVSVPWCQVIHRDLKLENILLDDQGTVKVADFGLSNSIKFGQKMNTNCGTLSYTCPEQVCCCAYVVLMLRMESCNALLHLPALSNPEQKM